MFYLRNDATGSFARHDSIGQHDGLTTDDVSDAAEFATYGEASDYSQNFGPDWSVMDGYDEPHAPVFWRALSRELPAQ